MDSFSDVLWLFFVYSFLGWCTEVVFHAAKHGRFVNRGFLMGCMCPIYGFGMLAVLWLLQPVKDNFLLLFLGSMVITTAIEFLIGFISEKILHTRLWDYSDTPLNICGYVCLQFSLLWGLGALAAVTAVHPTVENLIDLIPKALSNVLLTAFSAVALSDFIVTGINALHIEKHMKAVEDTSRLICSVSDKIGSGLSSQTIKIKEHLDAIEPTVREKYEKLLKKQNIFHRHIFNAFPNLRKGKYKTALELLESMRPSRHKKNKNNKKHE